ncbi:hypothetical protein MJO28_007372 [Puccinia striiformis f. sp. tritici]|uniref:Uncharacterized protein n=1 Tax=Puccinia striiformis f. sp. tritici TaxID=168172 RepID=A0ACC0EFH1_9BASI|nr:hypothetical protein MJO28_007372 [Puccinia striiformis f. sp. tritici]
MSTRKTTTQDNTGTTPSISDVTGIVPVADDITPTGSQAAPKDITVDATQAGNAALRATSAKRTKPNNGRRGKSVSLAAPTDQVDGGSTGDLDQTEHVPVPDTLDVNTSCLDGMRDIPSSDDEDVVIGKLTHKSTDKSTSINKESMSSETRKFLWKLAMDADLKGNAAMANKLFQMTRNSTEESPVGKQGSNPKRGLDITALPKPLTAVLNTRAPFIDEFCLASDTECTAPTALTSAAIVSHTIGETRMQGGLAFASGAVTTNTAVGFSPYLNKCIRELRGTIPLTVFNRKWQEDAQAPDPKRQRVDESTTKATGYVGYCFDSEWTQTCAVWERNHCSMYEMLVDVYQLTLFAKDLLQHKKNVDNLHLHHGFLPAFRYDILMRTNTFNQRVSINGVDHVPDISKFRRDVWQIVYSTSHKADEFNFTDNPYVEGGARHGWDTTTGTYKSTTDPKRNKQSNPGNYYNNRDHYQQSNSSYGNNSSGGMNNNDNAYLDQNYLPGNSNSRSFHRNESSDSRPTRGGRNGFKGGFRGNGKAKAKSLDHQNQ